MCRVILVFKCTWKYQLGADPDRFILDHVNRSGIPLLFLGLLVENVREMA